MADRIVQAGHPVLRAPAERVAADRLGSDELKALVQSMIVAMRAAPGVGLAAPQIGVPLRVIVLEDSEALMSRLSAADRAARQRSAFPLTTIVNPVMVRSPDAGRAFFFEGCLSVPGYMALVERDLEVTVTGTDEDGKPVDIQARGWPARILQHEVDHLDGTLYVDRMASRSFGANEEIAARWLALDPNRVREALKA